MNTDLTALGERFRLFGSLQNHGVTSLYTLFSDAVAADPDLLEIAAQCRKDQPAPNMLFGAVHYLLLNGVDHPLTEYYDTCVPDPRAPDQNAAVLLRAFILDQRAAVSRLVAERRTQTNEVGRSALLLPAFHLAAQRSPGLPLHLIEIGPSAGFNLNWHRYAYDYGAGGQLAPAAGPAGSPLRLTTELESNGPGPVPDQESFQRLAIMTIRSGFELNPIDLESSEDRLWLEALVWPGYPKRRAQLQQAIEIARRHPPEILPGDAVESLPDFLTTVQDAIPVVCHSFALYQFSPEDRLRFRRLLAFASRRKPLIRISLEWIGTANPALKMETYTNGRSTTERLAECHPHGAWLRWEAI